jgi:hypothetical protein
MIDFLVSALWNLVMLILPLGGTIFLGWVAWKLWMHYIQHDFISGIEWVLLEITPPRDVLRSPRGMELFLTNALYHWSVKGGREQYWQGAVWFWFSLEIASIDGQVHFYVRAPSRLKELIETQMYAQYPQAQIKVVEDYTFGVDEITPRSAWNLYGCEFKLEKPEAFPIRTYVDFGLDKDPKEEFKVDPISPIIELFASIEKGEQMWMQIVITPSKKEYRTHGVSWLNSHKKKYHDWVAETQVVLDRVLKPYTATKDEGARIETRTPDALKGPLEGITKKRTKLGFDTGIRACYVAKKENFSMNNRRNLRLIFRQYANPSLNSLTRFNGTQPDAYGGYFLASPKTVMMLANRMLNEYRERDFFHPPLRHKIFNKHTVFWPLSLWVKPYFHSETFVLNVEELATMWHFPGQILKVPSFERIESKEAAPPTNLPI